MVGSPRCEYGEQAITMDQYRERIFLRDDPHAKLQLAREAAKAQRAPRRRKGVPAREARPSEDGVRVQKLLEQGPVEPSVTRERVLMSVGCPPGHRTPTLDPPMWTYWQNRWVTMKVYFDGDRVGRVAR